jgi:hypothetical protein
MIKFIDTEPDKNKHTPLCSCDFCIKMKQLCFGDMPIEFKKELKDANPILYQVLVSDGVWRE